MTPGIWAELDAMHAAAAAEPPEGSFSFNEYCDRYSLKEKTAYAQLSKLVTAKRLETGLFLRRGRGVKRSWQRYYWGAKPCRGGKSATTPGKRGRA